MIHYYGCTNHQWYRNIFGYALVYIPSGLKSFDLLLPAINIVAAAEEVVDMRGAPLSCS